MRQIFLGMALAGVAGSASAAITFGPAELVYDEWRGSAVTTLDVAADGTLGVTVSNLNVANFIERASDGTYASAVGINSNVDGSEGDEDLRDVRGVYVGNDARFVAGHNDTTFPYPAWTGVAGSGVGQYISTTVDNARRASMDVDAEGNNVFASQSRGNTGSAISYVHESADGGATWSTTQIFQSGQWNPVSSRITADTSGAYMIFDHQDQQGIYLSDSVGGWNTGSSNGAGSVDTGDLFEVVAPDSARSIRAADVARSNGETFVAYVDGNYAGNTESALIIRDSSDNFASEIRIDGGWAPDTSTGVNWFDLQMVEIAGDLGIVYQDGDGDIKFAYGSDATWDIQTIYDANADSPHAPAIAVDGSTVYVSYATSTGNPDEVWLKVGVIPEPATATLLAGLGLGMLARRRRHA